jgi:autotransporter-associated beta strand protein
VILTVATDAIFGSVAASFPPHRPFTPHRVASGGIDGTNTGVGGAGGTSPGGGAGGGDTGGYTGGGAYGGGGGGGSGFTGGGGGDSVPFQSTGGPGVDVGQPFTTFTNPAGSIFHGGVGGQGNTGYGATGGGGAGVGGGGGGGGGSYIYGGGGGGGAGVGGGGGAGGYGAGGVGGPGGNITGTARIINNGKIYGGAGAAGITFRDGTPGGAGNGGDAIGVGGGGGLAGGNGGAGGVGGGITGPATIINSGLLQGGNGGAPSLPGLTDGGVGGVGVRGSNLTIVNSGTIAGGFDGNTGTVQSNAILFTGGANSLELQEGWVIGGNVGNASGVTGTTNTLILGGSSTNLSGNGAATGTIFDVSQIGGKYQNFDLFQKSGASTWQLTSTTAVTTPWTITGGTLQISDDAALGSPNGAFTFGGADPDTGLPGSGTLEVTATTSATRNVVLNNIVGFANTIDVSGANDYTIGGVISGQGGLTKADSGALILTANDTYSGGTTIGAGTLQLGNGGTSGAIVGGVLDNGTLAFDHSDTLTFGGMISGTGAVNQIGSGTTILTANDTYSGGTTIGAGTLQLGNGGTSGAIVGDVTDNGRLAFNRSDTVTFPGVISGSGGLSQLGSGTTILTADNPYTGGTIVSAGTLAVGDFAHQSAALSGGGPIAVDAGGTLGGYGSVTGPVTNSGVIAPGNATPGFLGSPIGAFTIKGNYIGAGGTLAVNTFLGGDGSPSDILAISGAGMAATGNTMVRVTNVGGPGAETTNGILVVNAVNGATTTPGAFTLANGELRAGAFDYDLFRGGVSPAAPTTGSCARASSCRRSFHRPRRRSCPRSRRLGLRSCHPSRRRTLFRPASSFRSSGRSSPPMGWCSLWRGNWGFRSSARSTTGSAIRTSRTVAPSRQSSLPPPRLLRSTCRPGSRRQCRPRNPGRRLVRFFRPRSGAASSAKPSTTTTAPSPIHAPAAISGASRAASTFCAVR